MDLQLILKTERLILRPFRLSDSKKVQALAGNKLIADVTANIPHPYPEAFAKEWIQSHPEQWKNKQLASYAITFKEELIGAISLMYLNTKEAELGYWIGVDYWNKGYCTEACREIIDFGFNDLQLLQIKAHHLSRNPASGRVLLNSGLRYVGSSESICGYRKEKEPTEVYEIIKRA